LRGGGRDVVVVVRMGGCLLLRWGLVLGMLGSHRSVVLEVVGVVRRRMKRVRMRGEVMAVV